MTKINMNKKSVSLFIVLILSAINLLYPPYYWYKVDNEVYDDESEEIDFPLKERDYLLNPEVKIKFVKDYTKNWIENIPNPKWNNSMMIPSFYNDARKKIKVKYKKSDDWSDKLGTYSFALNSEVNRLEKEWKEKHKNDPPRYLEKQRSKNYKVYRTCKRSINIQELIITSIILFGAFFSIKYSNNLFFTNSNRA